MGEHSAKNRRAALAGWAPKDDSQPRVDVFRALVSMAIESSEVSSQEAKQKLSSQEQTFDNVYGAYAAILAGCLIREQTAAEERLSKMLSEAQFTQLVEHLRDYMYFQQAAGINQGDMTCIKLIIISFEKLRGRMLA